jgi:hypothetical protein
MKTFAREVSTPQREIVLRLIATVTACIAASTAVRLVIWRPHGLSLPHSLHVAFSISMALWVVIPSILRAFGWRILSRPRFAWSIGMTVGITPLAAFGIVSPTLIPSWVWIQSVALFALQLVGLVVERPSESE